MREIALFVEDYAHQQVIGALVKRFEKELNICVRLNWRSARRGYGMVVHELKEFLRDLRRQAGQLPDLIIVATDANCKGFHQRSKELNEPNTPAPMILAIPDPHIERWLLLDGQAFKSVFGRGCNAPDLKCSRDRYKQRLIEEIKASGITPSLGGIEFADEIVGQMDMQRACHADKSLNHFWGGLSAQLGGWKSRAVPAICT